ncbi:MAG TPA: aminotransferase class I/II-fold pyridoxal phosphate-dependent enzyme [Ignavibacteriaceae bacterium]|nr:aminotransferase class I/II-fold pyridoxal phosphate-dependent enzyme [Ignavibacteriaceae bacterium]
MKKETKSIRIQTEKSKHREHSVPLYLTSSFVFDNTEQGRALFANEAEGDIYSRLSNPNVTEFVKKMIALENAEAGSAFATGMAAVFASLAALLKSGEHVVASRSIFGSTHQLLTKILPKWEISHTYVDGSGPDAWEKAINEKTRIIFAETPSNPQLEIIDLEILRRLKEKHNLILIIDNTFATPVLQTPADFNADLIIHSATKFIDGQGRVLGGVIAGKRELIMEIEFFARHTGPSLSPFNAWMLSKSLETLFLRMEKHSENALKFANYFKDNSEIESLLYPFLPTHPQYSLAKKQMKLGGAIVTLTLKGGYRRAEKFMDALQVISRTPNLGDAKSSITHPASTTHSNLTEKEKIKTGITPGLMRLSVGLENIQDIIDDVEQALKKSKAPSMPVKGEGNNNITIFNKA